MSIVLIHPPVSKPCEPPAGIARIAGALKSHGVHCKVIDANIEGFYYLLNNISSPQDTWSKRAFLHRQSHLEELRQPGIYQNPDRYRRAVADIGRLLASASPISNIQIGLGDYHDGHLTPVRSSDLIFSANHPENNPFYGYYLNQLLPSIMASEADTVGISVNYLSQALCSFSLVGLLKKARPGLKIILGGGLITSWMRRSDWKNPFAAIVDQMVCGPGEISLLQAAGIASCTNHFLPDYTDLLNYKYLSPGFILPFSTADGCWWRRCAFCPERAEKRPYRPLPHAMALNQLTQLAAQTSPTLIHLLDNAISPALLKKMAAAPPITAWYGFARIGPPLDDPDFCRHLAASGCVMLKIGLESGNQYVLDRLAKGILLRQAEKVLDNLHHAGIATYVYLLFGTPVEKMMFAQQTLDFVADHHETIGFLNLAIFNLPRHAPEGTDLELQDFYEGDLALYQNFNHPNGWNRTEIRRFLAKKFKKHPAIQPILRRDPPVFTSNHAPFFSHLALTYKPL